MKKNGFVFVETIVAIVILASALLLLYTSFHKILQAEKTRVNYDDVNYVYRTWYIKSALSGMNFIPVLNDLSGEGFITIGEDYESLFLGYENELEFIKSMLNDYDVNQIILFEGNKKDDLEKCKKKEQNDLCEKLFEDLSEDFVKYIKSVTFDLDDNPPYFMLIEFNGIQNERNYYSWVSV